MALHAQIKCQKLSLMLIFCFASGCTPSGGVIDGAAAVPSPTVNPAATPAPSEGDTGQCKDSAGQIIPAQFVDQTKNSAATVVDCYSDNQLVYSGTATNCYDELTARFGADIIIPTQTLLPNLYEQARAQGANGQQALILALHGASCAELKAQGG